MSGDLLKLAEEFKRLDRKKKAFKGKLPPAEKARHIQLQRILSEKLHGESPSERRKELRVPAAIRVRYHAEQTFVNNYIHNLSKGGIFVSTPKPLPLNSHLKLKLIFQDKDKEIEVEGKVVWENTQKQARQDITRPGMGVKFTKISDEAQAMIDDLIHDNITESAKERDELDKQIDCLTGIGKNKKKK